MEMLEVIPVCHCGNPSKLNTSWSNGNPGRRFFGCKKFGSRFRKPCRFFSWFDPLLTSHSRIVLLGLLKKVRTLEDARKRVRRTWLLVLVIVTVLLFLKA
ncbi:hypothetical protein ES332_A10G103500v1 [Gossypium tomentosum]|uniref:GRF-type domain-containing protein n=1 Tax=Gossypium tomentosum TaxID=34277 RepID=A0A5D2NTK9_GOSTO|nr:hypothetical protein ES332_A10G103500v1 [Gossypium tomentosum]